ncbi:MAG: hypothetical protein JXR81_06980 [Candidatus Goldbacteria bacterium]|nr:hypothetical protein [Candidatus Goldiibacteriota bacterium]
MKKTAGILFLVFICLFILSTGCNPKRNPTTPDLTPIIPGISTPVPTPTAVVICTLPDFTITGMAQGFSGVTIGCVEDYNHPGFIVYLKNQGCAAVTGAVSLNVNGVIINYAYNGGLAPGETESIWVENAPASGSMMSAIVDPSNNLPESNETNNSFQDYVLTLTPPPTCIQSATITPTSTYTSTPTLFVLTTTPSVTPTGSHTTGGPDLVVISVITQLEFPDSCTDGDEGGVGTRVVIKNIGDADAVGFIDIAMTGHGTQQVTGAMMPGAERTVFFSGTSWPNNSVITVDSTSNIAETDETNNVFDSVVPICTQPPTCVNTPDITNTVTATPTVTATITMTPTITPAVACLTAKIKSDNRYNELYTNINFTGSCVAANLQYRIAIYDGADNLITTKTAYSGYGGVLRYIYTSTGSDNISAPWHVAIMLPSYNPPAVYNASDAGFEDICEFTVMVSAPAPTPTLPCTNMVGVYHGQLTLIKYFNYKLNDCNAFTIKVDYCTENTRVALYDAGNNLLKTELLTCQTPGMSAVQMFYHIAGTEVPGIWYIDLYGESDSVPAVRTTGGTISSCPEGSLIVE